MFHDNLNDTELTNSLLRGDEFAFNVLFKRYYSSLCKFAYRYLRNKEEAEEAVSEVFMHIWQKRKSIDISVSLKSYLYACVRNSSIKKLKNSRKAESTLNEEYPETDLNAFEDLQVRDVNAQLYSVIDLLPARCKEVFLMCKIDGLKHKEIAILLEISERTVEQHMANALEFLRRKLLLKKRFFN